MAGAIRFPDDRVHAAYDRDAVDRPCLALVEKERAFNGTVVGELPTRRRAT